MKKFMSDELYRKGMEIRRAVLGNAHVDKAEANQTDFDAEFQEYITTNVWGNVWSRPGLSQRERSLVVIAMLVALGKEEELTLHVKATQNTGASKDDVKEVLLTASIYAGVPAANQAFKIAKQAFSEMEIKDK